MDFFPRTRVRVGAILTTGRRAACVVKRQEAIPYFRRSPHFPELRENPAGGKYDLALSLGKKAKN